MDPNWVDISMIPQISISKECPLEKHRFPPNFFFYPRQTSDNLLHGSILDNIRYLKRDIEHFDLYETLSKTRVLNPQYSL